MNTRMSSSLFSLCLLTLYSSLCSLCLCGESFAADLELSKPYKLQVVLRFSDHRDLTDVLKEKVERELRDNLRAAFGDVVQVEVVRTHPRLKEIEEKGLQSLDSWKDVNGIKTHFVLIDYVDNAYYQIRARQHDGYTGQASPVIRRERTNSRDFLARSIGLLLDRDFGVVGEVTNPGDENTVEVTLKGAGLDVPLSRWVRRGDVFGLVKVVQGGGRPKADEVPSALLQAEDVPNKSGVVKCRFFHRYKLSLGGASRDTQYRCIKLGTTKAPLRLRLVEAKARTPRPLNGYTIGVQRQGFGSEKGDTTSTDSDGFTKLLGKAVPFDNVAFVLVYNPQRRDEIPLARVPVPILDDRPVIIALNIQQEAATPLELRQRFWLRRINDRLVEDQGIFADLNRDVPQADKLAATLEKARIIKVGLDEDIANFEKERKELEEAVKETPGAALDFTEGNQRLQLLERDRDELDKFVTGLRDGVERQNDPARRELHVKWQEAKGYERDKDYDKAIKLYEEAQAGLNDPGLAKHIAKLKDVWKPKSDEHKRAREFIYNDWPQFDADRMKEHIGNARAAFLTCKKAGDYLTPQKLLRVALSHDAKLKEILADLHPDVNDDQKQPYAEALAAINDLAKLITEVTNLLKETLKE